MKLRQAKKICRNYCNDICSYSSETIAKATRKYRPYLLRECDRKNAELEAAGSNLRYAPYIIKETVPIVGNYTPKRQVSSRYCLVNAEWYPKLSGTLTA